MTETDWLSSCEPEKMFHYLARRGWKLSQRKSRLLAAALVLRLRYPRDGIESWLTSQHESALHTSERFADEPDDTLRALLVDATQEFCQQLTEVSTPPTLRAVSTAVVWAIDSLVDMSLRSIMIMVADDRTPRASYIQKHLDNEKAAQTELIRCVVGNPFHHHLISERWDAMRRWNDSLIVRLAETAYRDKSFSILPILADALEEAGCANEEMLEHLRHAGSHVRGCWVLDLILDKA